MCGIGGFCDEAGGVMGRKDALCRMLQEMRHRGPDDEGIFISEHAALGMTRLSIIDLDGGHQPVFSEDGRFVLVCNGEIYNYRELREDLIAQGHVFTTQTDIEVIVHLFEADGHHCLHKLEGMFAFAVWDKERQELFLARDRFGIKPLYYTHQVHANRFIFASELDPILQVLSQPLRIDPLSLHQYLRREHVPAPRSIIEGVQKLPAAHMLVYRAGEVHVRPYWDMASVQQEPAMPQARLEKELLSLLQKSVAGHLISDVPWGVFLSGGIDSSMLVALAAGINQRQIMTFSIGFEESSFDETSYGRRVAALYKTQHHHHVFSACELVSIMDEASGFLDEPFADGSYFPTYALSRFARGHVKVALSGEGADEIFGGYPTYLAHAAYLLYRHLPPWLRKHIIDRSINALPVSRDNFSLDFVLKKFISSSSGDLFRRHMDWMGAFSQDEMSLLFKDKAKEALSAAVDHELDVFSGACPYRDPLTRVQYLDIKTYLQDGLLTKADRASMAHGLEVRVPYLDRRLVEFAMRLPPQKRVHCFQGKYLFKRVAASRLPGDIVHRRKKGFGMPVGSWLSGPLKEAVNKIFIDGCLMDAGWFDPDHMRQLWQDHLACRADHRKKLWTLIMLEMWLKKRRQLL